MNSLIAQFQFQSDLGNHLNFSLSCQTLRMFLCFPEPGRLPPVAAVLPSVVPFGRFGRAGLPPRGSVGSLQSPELPVPVSVTAGLCVGQRDTLSV